MAPGHRSLATDIYSKVTGVTVPTELVDLVELGGDES